MAKKIEPAAKWRISVESRLSGEDFEVLDGGNEQILDGLLDQSAPAGAFEAMEDGGVAKIAFLQPLAALAVSSGCRGVGLTAGAVQQFLLWIAVEGASGF